MASMLSSMGATNRSLTEELQNCPKSFLDCKRGFLLQTHQSPSSPSMRYWRPSKVGGNNNLPRQFMNLQEQSLSGIEATLNFNAGFTAKITRTLLPILMNNEPSLILNIGSLAALGVPRVSVHSGTKGFLVSHSESLPTELVAQGRDVTVHAVYVGPVQSGGYTPDDASLFVPTPRSMAQATTSQAGSRSRPS